MAKYTSDNVGKYVNKFNFAAVFREAFDQTVKVTTIVNSFRDSGIYPVNFSAIRSSKLSPSSVYSESESKSNEKSPSTEQCQASAREGEMCLLSLETMMSRETVSLFETRYEELYDVEDELYKIWVKLKELSVSGPRERSNETEDDGGGAVSKPLNEKMDIGISSTDSVKCTTGNSVLDEILIHPKVKQAKKVVKNSLPPHLSGAQMIQFLAEREEAKKQEEREKERRKQERIAKRILKEKEKEERERRRVERNCGRRQKGRGQTSHGRGSTALGRGQGRRSNRSEPPSLSSTRHLTSSSEDDGDDDIIRPICSTNASEDWIACDKCDTWYHLTCAGVPRSDYSHLDSMEWYCDECI